MIQICNIILGTFLLATCEQPSNKNEASYNLKVTFETGKPICFPDFTIEYTGLETLPGPGKAQFTLTFFYFTLKNGAHAKQISWSSGTGDIGPTYFEFNQCKFFLEMSHSEKLNQWLKQNEFVISIE